MNKKIIIMFFVLLLLVPNALAFNPFYKFLGLFVKFAPEIESANVYPVKIRPGDVLLINVTAKDVYGISKVTAKVYHESGFDLVDLALIKNNNYQGTWICHNAKNMEWYDVDIEVINIYGVSSFTKTQYQDPTKSHPAAEVTAGTFDAGDFTFQGNVIASEPTASTHVTTKAYVDASVGGIGYINWSDCEYKVVSRFWGGGVGVTSVNCTAGYHLVLLSCGATDYGFNTLYAACYLNGTDTATIEVITEGSYGSTTLRADASIKCCTYISS